VTANDTRRVDMTFGIGYNDDLLKAKKTLERIVSEEPRVLPEPTPLIQVMELADSSVNFVVRPWVKTSDYWGVYYALTEKVKLVFDQEGISIPYPQQDVHIYPTGGDAE
jgi:small conductance mechanosensitive channel